MAMANKRCFFFWCFIKKQLFANFFVKIFLHFDLCILGLSNDINVTDTPADRCFLIYEPGPNLRDHSLDKTIIYTV
ncbi:hypothetical protein M0804_009265 [Polistes exclamans]|nr:hypothetical protein M0804_009265 [Polistes exclamans]